MVIKRTFITIKKNQTITPAPYLTISIKKKLIIKARAADAIINS